MADEKKTPSEDSPKELTLREVDFARRVGQARMHTNQVSFRVRRQGIEGSPTDFQIAWQAERARYGFPYRGSRASEVEPYSEFKAMLTEAVTSIKTDIHEEHELTRKEVRLTRQEIVETIKSSPSQYVRLMSEMGMAICAFALLVNWILSVELINTVFACFLIFCFAVYWVMAWTKERRGEEKKPST